MRPQVARLAVLLVLAGCSSSASHAPDAGGAKDAGAPDSPSCARTCAGCCAGQVCFAGTTPQSCGAAGATCQTCTTDRACTSGACGPAPDPCNGVTANGRCASNTRVEVCVAPTGNGTPTLSSYDCVAGEACQVNDGVAGCVLTAVCAEGTTECAGATEIRTCEAGAWLTSACLASCARSPLGDYCASADGLQTLSGHVAYQTRPPNTSLTD